MKRVLVGVAAAVAAVLLGACRVELDIAVEARANGTGEVRVTAVLDEAAAEEAGDFEKDLRTADLEAAGWLVEDPERLDGGGVALTVRHPFSSPAEAEAAMAQLGGSDGPFRSFALTQTRTFFRTETEFSGTVDLTRGVEAFSDPALAEAFGGVPLGVSVEQLERQLGAPFDRLLAMQVAVRLPGSVDSNGPATAEEGSVWTPQLGEQTTLQATAARWNMANIVALVIAVASAAGLVVVVVLRRRRTPAAPR